MVQNDSEVCWFVFVLEVNVPARKVTPKFGITGYYVSRLTFMSYKY